MKELRLLFIHPMNLLLYTSSTLQRHSGRLNSQSQLKNVLGIN